MRFYTHLDQFSTTGLDICCFFLFSSRRLFFCLISLVLSLVLSSSSFSQSLYVKWKSYSKNIRHIAITKCGSTLRDMCTIVSLVVVFFCLVSYRFFAVALLNSFVFYRRRRHTNEACDIHFFLANLTAPIKCVLNKHFIRSFMYA